MDLANKIKNDELEASKKAASLLLENWESTIRSSRNSGSYKDCEMNNESNDSEMDFHGMDRDQLISYIGEDSINGLDKVLSDYSDEDLIEIAIEKHENTGKEAEDVIVTENRRVNLGLYSTLKDLRKSPINEHAPFRIIAEKYMHLMGDQGIPESALIDQLIKEMDSFKWDDSVKAKISFLSSTMNENASLIEVEKAIFSIRKNSAWKFYSDATKLMTEWIKTDNRSNRILAKDLTTWKFNPVVNNLINKLNEMESKNVGGLNIPSKQGESYVSKVYSPILMENGNTYFYINGKYYSGNDTGIKTVEKVNEKFSLLVESFNNKNLKIDDNGITFYINKNRISIVEESNKTEILLNGSKLSFDGNLGLANILEANFSNIMSNGRVSIVSDIIRIYENFENIVDLDFVKSVNSRIYEGALVNLIKWNGEILVNKINESMRENSIYKTNGRQAVRIVKDFLNYDISEGLSDYLEGEDRIKSIMVNDRSKVLENISFLESEISKIDNAISSNSRISESAEIMDARKSIENEIEFLREKWNTINQEIGKLDSIDFDSIPDVNEDVKFSIGDTVKIKESGDTGKIISIDGTSGSFTVLKDNGQTGDFRVDEIVDLEEALKRASEDSEESSDETEGGEKE